MSKLISVIFLFLLSIHVLAQSSDQSQIKIDSMEIVLKSQKKSIEKCKTLNELSHQCYMLNPELGIKYGNQALELSSELKYDEGIAFANLYLGKNISMKGEYSKSLVHYEKAQQIFEKLNDECSLGQVYLSRGIAYGNLSKFPDSLDSFFDSLGKFENCDTKDKNLYSANAFQNIGNVYNFTENYEKALKYYDQAINLYQKIPSQKSAVAMNIALKGFVYEKLKKYQDAIHSYEKAENMLLSLNDSVQLAFVKNWKASAYLGLDEFDLSLKNSKEILKTVENLGDQELLASTYQNMGISYLKKAQKTNFSGEFQLAFQNLSKSLEIHKKTKNHEGLIKDYLHLSDYYSSQKNFKKSLEAHQLYAAYNDSIFNFKNKQSLQNHEDVRTIEIRDKEIELNRISLLAKEKQKWLYIIGIVLLGVIGALLYYQSQNRKKSNENLLKLNSELDLANKNKLRFLGILNHDLRSPVSKLIHFLHLQKENPELLDEETKERMEAKTMFSAQNLLESMEEILLWSKGQMENFTPNFNRISVNAVFTDLQKHFYSSDVPIHFENKENLEITTDENYLKTIMRNLTGNAIKATESIDKPSINWKAWKENNSVFLSISDNGKGGSEESFKALMDEKTSVGIQSGLGLHLVRDLAKAINCQIEIDSEINHGTIITLILNP